jgi:hypothetical protein
MLSKVRLTIYAQNDINMPAISKNDYAMIEESRAG